MENIKVHLLAIYVHIYRWILDMQIMYIYRQNICILDRKCISDMKKKTHMFDKNILKHF